MDTIDWIEQNLRPTRCNSEAFFYDEMESQSGFYLPVIYQPFDPANYGHWCDRGSLYDFLYAVEGEGKTLLDFGPGDGWPSLIVAPFAREVFGADGSRKRVAVCTQNAARLGITNAHFQYVEPGSPLPFPDGTFDGVMAASSIEQTPDPKATLRELFRVLRPNGRLRIYYEGLSNYQGGRENEIDLESVDDGSSWLTFYARDIKREVARMARLKLALPAQAIKEYIGQEIAWSSVDLPHLEYLCKQVREARLCTLFHPSGATFVRWMKEIGFREAQPTHSGAWFAGQLFKEITAGQRPGDLEGVDALLRPLVKIAVRMAAPLDGPWSPMITAVK